MTRASKSTLDDTREHAQRLIVERRWADALEYLEGAVETFPDDPELRLLFGTTLMDTRPEEVFEQVALAIKLDDRDPVRLTRAAGLLFTLGYVEAAASYVARAIDSTPDGGFVLEPDLMNISGHLAADKGDDGLAEEAFREAVRLEPSVEKWARDLAEFLATRDREP